MLVLLILSTSAKGIQNARSQKAKTSEYAWMESVYMAFKFNNLEETTIANK